MMTVTFPTGLRVTYSDARFLNYKSSAWELYTANPEEGGRWVASIAPGAGCIVETLPPSKIESAASNTQSVAELLAEQPGELRRLPRWTLRKLKRALAKFKPRSGEWIG